MKNKILFYILIVLSIYSCDLKPKNNTEPKVENITISKSDSTNNTRINRISSYKTRIDSINQSLQWKELKCGLWLSKKNDLGFKTTAGNEQGIFITKYITDLWNSDSPIKLNSVIDTLTFNYLGSSFYKDKNNIYTHYSMADGGFFKIVENADHRTFKIIGDCYAKDKNHIFGVRKMILDSVDYKTFKTKKGIGCYAKDKNGYYFWDNKLNEEEINDTEIMETITALKKL
ncbi:DKNYY domain-containing protein [Maribacter sp. Asnod2-G09]|uniref:DKNYY domain-containing protein n=1 Tax=Maribacter sp. Asnod2-G09 TaxID=3160577 RepID=UPI003868C577